MFSSTLSISGEKLTEALQKRARQFDERFESTFQLKAKVREVEEEGREGGREGCWRREGWLLDEGESKTNATWVATGGGRHDLCADSTFPLTWHVCMYWVTSRPKGRLRPRELCFSLYSCIGIVIWNTTTLLSSH